MVQNILFKLSDLVEITGIKKSSATSTQKSMPLSKAPFEYYKIEEVLEYLMIITHEILDEKDQDFLQGGLMYLYDQVETPKYQRNQSGIRTAWWEIYPVMMKYKMLEVFPAGSWSRDRIMMFLLGL